MSLASLSQVDTIVIVIMENRSFDHMLGYLSLNNIVPVEGLRKDAAWQASYANPYEHTYYPLFKIDPHDRPCLDPQHNYQSINKQIESPPAGPGRTQMGGFVESYATLSDPKPTDHFGAVMGYFDGDALPTYSFFAEHYCVCDHWFAALPLGTQANRLMAMAGESLVLDNAPVLLPEQDLVYDWLTNHDISWCAYQAGDFLPFFSLMASWLPEIASQLTLSQMGFDVRFRRYSRLKANWHSSDPMPKVVFVEPEYSDGPHCDPNDDHPPIDILKGQAFLADLYNTLISNPARWAKTLLVVTYDEHGGFFDHLPPLAIPSTAGGMPISTTGVRVPAFLVSPWVRPSYVFDRPLDHTSLLQLLDDRFLKGEGYSSSVNQRQYHLDRILNALLDAPRTEPPPSITDPRLFGHSLIRRTPTAPNTPNAQALHAAARKLQEEHPQLLGQPGWAPMKKYLKAADQN